MEASEERPYFLLLGDSMCQNSFAENGWGARLAAHYCRKADIVNRGFGGYNTRWILRLLKELNLLSTLPRKDRCLAVFIWIVNDTVLASSGDRRFVPLDEFSRNMSEILQILIDFFERSDLTIVLITPPPIVESKRLAYQRDKFKDKATGVCERSTTNNGLYAKALAQVVANFQDRAKTALLDARAVFLAQENWEDLLEDGLHLSPLGDAVIFKALLQTIEEKCPQVSYSALPNHMRWHDEIDRVGNAMQGNFEKENETSSSKVTVLKGAKLWDWATMSFVTRTIGISDGKFIPVPAAVGGYAVEEVDLSDRYVLPGLVDGEMKLYGLRGLTHVFP